MSLLLINQSEVPMPRAYLQGWFVFVRKQLVQQKVLTPKDHRDLSLVFLDQKAARAMNCQFRGKDYATDVLSFESGDPESFGDLAICSQVAKTQSREHGLSYRDELAYLFLHGWLHLLGFEHENGGKEAEKMYALQDQIFEKIAKFRSLR